MAVAGGVRIAHQPLAGVRSTHQPLAVAASLRGSQQPVAVAGGVRTDRPVTSEAEGAQVGTALSRRPQVISQCLSRINNKTARIRPSWMQNKKKTKKVKLGNMNLCVLPNVTRLVLLLL